MAIPPKHRYTAMWCSLPTNDLSTSQLHKISVALILHVCLLNADLIGSQEN